jgi:hypothetical protein
MDFNFFITENKSGYKTREKWLSKNHPDLYNNIIQYCDDLKLNLSFKEKIWFFYHKLNERPKCITCKNELVFRERFDKPYGEFCSLECINSNKEEMKKRQTKTLKEKYNVEYFPQHKDFLPKQRRTKLLKYGNENYNNNLKGKETKKNKYKNENYNNSEKHKETCLLKYGTDNYSKSNNYKNKKIDEYKKLYPNVEFNTIGKDFVKIVCEKCNTVSKLSKQLIYERYKRNYSLCLNCNPIGNNQRSGYELEICEFLKTLNVEYKTNVKLTNSKYEIDIFIPSINLGIELNGVYWHNELFKSPNYHLKKTILSQKENIDLIHIFEDEWIFKKEIVKSIIKNRIKLNTKVIYGRNCEIKEIDYKSSKVFLNENHIQGNVNSKYRIGLFHNNQLVSLMTFGNGRIMMGGKKNEFELTRFCNLIDCNIIGSASKLIKFFIKKYNPNKIVSYSDIRLFNGDLYSKLNFERKNQSKPNYWYVVDGIRKNRFNYRKSRLVKLGFDKNKTEKEIMFERKIYRIYDCGNIRWELNLI